MPCASSVIVTRPAEDAAPWIEQLTLSGFQVDALPLIEIAVASDPADALLLQTAWKNLDQYAACMFVSGNAAAYFFKQNRPMAPERRAQAAPDLISNDSRTGFPDTLRFLAPGPGTANVLQAWGVPAAQIDAPALNAAQFDSSALWEVVGLRDWQGKRVLIVRGRSQSADLHTPEAAHPPRDWLTQKWQAAGSSVDVVHVYERRAPHLNAAQADLARCASTNGSVWLFSSSEAVVNLRSSPRLAGVDWRTAIAVATHPRILEAVRDAGFGVVRASRPALPEIVQALRSIESQRHES